VVDAGDYVLWRHSVGGTDLHADGDHDAAVGPGDYDVWREDFGAVATESGAGQTDIMRSTASTLTTDSKILPIFLPTSATTAQAGLGLGAERKSGGISHLTVSVTDNRQSPSAFSQRTSSLLLVRQATSTSEK